MRAPKTRCPPARKKSGCATGVADLERDQADLEDEIEGLRDTKADLEDEIVALEFARAAHHDERRSVAADFTALIAAVIDRFGPLPFAIRIQIENLCDRLGAALP